MPPEIRARRAPAAPRRRLPLAVAAAALVTATACQQPGPTAITASAPAAAAATPARRVPLAELLAAVRAENDALVAIFDTSFASGTTLGQLNGKLQSRGYFRRVPSQPATDSLESNFKTLAAQRNLLVRAFDARTAPAPPPPEPVVLRPGESWQPELAHLRGVLHLRIELDGNPKDAAALVNDLPARLERLVVVTGSEPLTNGGLALLGEAYYERELPAPQIDVRWPSLEDRLRAGGWDPADPALARDPAYAELVKQVELGRLRVPDVRNTLKISADFPRWLLRAKFFEERGTAAMSTRGELLLGTTLN